MQCATTRSIHTNPSLGYVSIAVTLRKEQINHHPIAMTRFSLLSRLHVLQELQLPCLVVDGIVAFALHKLDSNARKKNELAQLAKKENLEHEQDKCLKAAQKQEARAEQKAMEKRAKEGAGKHPKHGNPIQQPDKNKKSK